MNFQIERLKKLPLQPQVRWQGGVFRIPAWLPNNEQKLYRPWSALWVDLSTGVVSEPITEPIEDPAIE